MLLLINNPKWDISCRYCLESDGFTLHLIFKKFDLWSNAKGTNLFPHIGQLLLHKHFFLVKNFTQVLFFIYFLPRAKFEGTKLILILHTCHFQVSLVSFLSFTHIKALVWKGLEINIKSTPQQCPEKLVKIPELKCKPSILWCNKTKPPKCWHAHTHIYVHKICTSIHNLTELKRLFMTFNAWCWLVN